MYKFLKNIRSFNGVLSTNVFHYNPTPVFYGDFLHHFPKFITNFSKWKIGSFGTVEVRDKLKDKQYVISPQKTLQKTIIHLVKFRHEIYIPQFQNFGK